MYNRRNEIAQAFGVLFTVLALAQLGCGSDDDAPPIEQLCKKADECNRLPPNVSVLQCAERTSACLDDLDKTDRAEWGQPGPRMSQRE
jgi:hypothetical protein